MKFYTTMNETLKARFDDDSEVQDVANHGCAGGYSGFTYNYEINEFFNEFEDEIDTYLYDIFGDEWMKECFSDCSDFQEMRNKAVWMAVEGWCSEMAAAMDAFS